MHPLWGGNKGENSSNFILQAISVNSFKLLVKMKYLHDFVSEMWF